MTDGTDRLGSIAKHSITGIIRIEKCHVLGGYGEDGHLLGSASMELEGIIDLRYGPRGQAITVYTTIEFMEGLEREGPYCGTLDLQEVSGRITARILVNLPLTMFPYLVHLKGEPIKFETIHDIRETKENHLEADIRRIHFRTYDAGEEHG
jgi:hypothetical protein